MIKGETPRVKPVNGKHEIVHACRQTEQLANAFLERLRVRGLSGNTATAYAYDLISLFRWLEAAKKDVFTFSRQDIFEYVKAQVEGDAKPRSINRRLVVCDLFLRFLHERSVPIHATHLARNTGAGGQSRTRGPWPQKRGTARLSVKVPHTIIDPLDIQEVNRFLAGVRHFRDLAIILLMALVGLRRAEILAIGLGDIDFDNKFIRIKGKGKKERVMPLPATVLTFLRKYLQYERPRSAQSPAMFLVLHGQRRGHAMTAAGLRSFFRKRRRALQMAHAHPHRFRHTFAYNMVKEGVSIVVLQKMLGHARYATTLQYVSLRPTDVREQYLKAIKAIEVRHFPKIFI
jgi:integrase/recombinase XerC